MNNVVPPEQFESFCVGFEVALCRDTPRKGKGDFYTFVDGAIAYGLDGWERPDLLILRDFLTSVLEGPNSAATMNEIWKNTHPRYEFFSGPDASVEKPAIIQIFTRVQEAIGKKLA